MTIRLSLAFALFGVACDDGTEFFSDAEWAIIRTLSPLPEAPPPDPTNAYADNPTAALLGQMLFFDKDLSGSISEESTLGVPGTRDQGNCAICHVPQTWFQTLDPSERTPMGLGGREEVNTLSLVNIGYNRWTMWEGGAEVYWSQAMEDLEGALDGSRLELAHILFDKYRAEYDAVFPEKLSEVLASDHAGAARFPQEGRPANFWEDAGEEPGAYEGMTEEDQRIVTRILVNYGKAIQAYQRVLISRNAPFDKFVAGNDGAISESAKRGLKLFIGKAACVDCHEGPTFSDYEFHNITVPAMGDAEWGVPDEDNLGFYEGLDAVLNGPFSVFNSSSEWSDDPNTGKLDDMQVEEDHRYAMRTQPLRHVAETAPYMHSGQFSTLREVVEFDNAGGQESGYAGVKDPAVKPLNLTEAEIDDIVAFLKTLTGEPPAPELLQDIAR